MERHPDIELVETRLIHSGRAFDVRAEKARLPSGLVQELVVIDHPGAVVVAALDGDGRVALVRQYRHAIGAWLLELPAGRLERGEEPERAARRELEEETGLVAREWRPLGSFYPAPGFCSEKMHAFVARGLSEVHADRRAHDDDEELELVRMSLGDALHAVAHDAKSWIALRRVVQS